MKRFRRSILSGILIFCFIISLLPAGNSASAKDGKSIGFLPFSILAARDLAHLGEGIRDMLASRLAAETGATVVNMAGVSGIRPEEDGFLQRFLEIGRDRQADLLVAGNLTSRDSGLSLEVKVYDLGTSAGPFRFFADGEGENEIFQMIDQLALQTAEKLYGMKRPASKAEVPEQPPAGSSPLQTAHPERPFLAPDLRVTDPDF